MFTGIVEETGIVQDVPPGGLTIGARVVLAGANPGDSINVNGACLTVVRLYEGAFAVDLMPETVRRTNLGSLNVGDPVNLERAVAVGERLGGHMVQGHVEGTGLVVSLTREGDAVLVRYEAPSEIMRYVVRKGFIAVDGVSLTVVDRDDSSFSVSLVQYTQENTNLTRRQPGDAVNLETDILARYVEQLLDRSTSQSDLSGTADG
jgi:riboflavin synthase